MSELAITAEQAKVLRRLRPPSARAPFLAFGYAREGRTNTGVTFELESGERPVAAGSGKVVAVVQKYASWQHNPGDLDTKHSFEVTIDHGSNVVSVTAGLLTVDEGIKPGLPVARGATLGTLVTRECFFLIAVNRVVQNPLRINRHFKLFDSRFVTGQDRRLRPGPDLIVRNLSNGIRQILDAGLRYFENIRQRWSLTISVDFNGDGTKTGIAATGALGDYWNVYAAGEFTQSAGAYYYYYYYACTGYTFNTSPQTFLYDTRGIKSPVWLERIQNATAAAGTNTWFDPMLSTYIGGVAEENFFALRGLPRGTYQIYVYGNDGTVPDTTTVYVAVDDGTPEVKQTNPTGVPAFIEDSNYVRFQVIVGSGSIVSVKVYGYLAGLQLTRT